MAPYMRFADGQAFVIFPLLCQSTVNQVNLVHDIYIVVIKYDYDL